MAKKAYMATIQVLVNADSEAQAADGITALLTERADDDFILDYQYPRIGGQRLTPTETTINDDYQEGDAF